VKARYLEGARAVAPIGVAAAAFGLSFGVLARAAGMGWAAPMVMSATTFAGSAQFAVASVLGNAGSAAAAIAAAVMLNARFAPISISVASAFEGSASRRLLQSQLIVDESWAIALRRRGARPRRRLPGPLPRAARHAVEGRTRGRRGRARRGDRPHPDPVHAGGCADRRRSGGVPRRLEEGVSPVLLSTLVVGAATAAFKATGRVLLGGRELLSRLAAPVTLLAPAVLAALVVTQAVGGHREIVVDARLAGLGVGVVAVALRAPLLAVVVAAAATATIVRLV